MCMTTPSMLVIFCCFGETTQQGIYIDCVYTTLVISATLQGTSCMLSLVRREMNQAGWSTLTQPAVPEDRVEYSPMAASFLHNCTLVFEVYYAVSGNMRLFHRPSFDRPFISQESLSTPTEGNQNTHLPRPNTQWISKVFHHTTDLPATLRVGSSYSKPTTADMLDSRKETLANPTAKLQNNQQLVPERPQQRDTFVCPKTLTHNQREGSKIPASMPSQGPSLYTRLPVYVYTRPPLGCGA